MYGIFSRSDNSFHARKLIATTGMPIASNVWIRKLKIPFKIGTFSPYCVFGIEMMATLTHNKVFRLTSVENKRNQKNYLLSFGPIEMSLKNASSPSAVDIGTASPFLSKTSK